MAVSEKIKSIVGFLTQGFERNDDMFEDMVEEMEMEYGVEDGLALAPSPVYQSRHERQNDLKVVAHPSYKGYEVRVVEPRSFSEVKQIAANLKDKKTIVLNLHLLDKEQSQRTIDFLCGAADALGGKPQKVGDMVFVFTPSNVTLSMETPEVQGKFNDAIWGRPL